MDNIEELLKEILGNQKETNESLKRIEEKLDATVNQTAELTEFRTETKQGLSDIKDTLKFVIHKEVENEKEIFNLKEAKK